jgi:hypothetical protein
MNEHILNIFTEKVSRVKTVRFSEYDSGIVNVLYTIFVLSSVHECAHASVLGHMNARWTLYGQQSELMLKCSEMERGGAAES